MKKGDLVLVYGEFPAFVSDNPRGGGKIPIYKFIKEGDGFEDVLESDLEKVFAKRWAEVCKEQEFKKDYIIDKMKWLGIKSFVINEIKGQRI